MNPDTPRSMVVTPARLPGRIVTYLRDYNIEGHVLTNLDLDLYNPALEMAGAKALLQAVVELTLPYSLERDDFLRGFLYGAEPLLDMNVSRALLKAEVDRIRASPAAAPIVLHDIGSMRWARFNERLAARLNALAASGQPEIPRLLGHTLRLVNLLRDSWGAVPPPALDFCWRTNSLRLVLYGEPYTHYCVQRRDDLNIPGWISFTATNVHCADEITAPLPATSHRFYRVMLPPP